MGTLFLLALAFGASVLIIRATRFQDSPSYKLTWSDEFDGPAGSAPDQTKWTYDIGGAGWGNNELESYTDRRENSYLDGQGNLVIKVIKEDYTGPDGIKRDYTSARMLTKGKFTQKYGRFEARIKMPLEQGIWPAFWMLGDDIDKVGWSQCGEIDIMKTRATSRQSISAACTDPVMRAAMRRPHSTLCLTARGSVMTSTFTRLSGKRMSCGSTSTTSSIPRGRLPNSATRSGYTITRSSC